MCAEPATGQQKRPVRGNSWIGCLAGGISAAILWLAVADTPFLQDDYGFLYEAIAAERRGNPYNILLLVTGDKSFWRPLSVGLHWRFVVDLLAGSALAAHLVGAFLIGIAAACVGKFSLLYLGRWGSDKPTAKAGFWASLLFGIHGAQFFPAAWACAVQETYAILFSAVALVCFVSFCYDDRARIWAGAASIIALVLALLSKEGPVVLPLVAAFIWAVAGSRRRRGLMLLAGWFVMVAVWIWGRSLIVTMPEEATPYAPTLGINVLRNAGLAILFMLNLPREAVLLWVTERSVQAVAWGVACVALQASAWGILLWNCRDRIMSRDWHLLVLPAISFVCLLPYLPLYSQAYPYYALLALLPYAMLVARVAVDTPRKAWMAGSCALASTLLLITGERAMPYPAPIARAQWAGEVRGKLVNDQVLRQSVSQHGALYVVAEDTNRFAALGSGSGLALLLNISKSQVHVQDKESSQTQLWVMASGVKVRQ